MRILIVITLSELGGAQTVVCHLANKLSEQNEIIVAAGEGDGKMWKMLNPNIIQENCPHLKRALSPIDDFLTILDFKKLYRKYKPDIIHLHSSKAGMLGRLAFPASKTIYTVHGFDSIRIAYRKFLPIERFMQRSCKAIVGVSLYDEKHLIEEKITHHVSTIYNGIEKPISLPENPFNDIKYFKGKILCVARMAYPKRPDLFIETARLLPEYAFIWIGNQHEVKEEFPNNIFFKGNLQNAGAYNEYADLFMLPSNYEGLPMVIIEAMSFGKPVVASNVGGISEIVRDGQNGYVVKNDASAFAEKIQSILDNPTTKETFAKNARDIFQKELTVDKMAEAYLDVFNKIY